MGSISRLLAVDPSLTCSGWALFDLGSGELLGVGELRSLPPHESFSRRLTDLQGKVSRLYDYLSLSSADVMVCEAPTTMRDPRAAIVVEQVRGMFEVLARLRLVSVPGRLNPRSVQHEVMGLVGRQVKRREVKHSAVTVAAALYGDKLSRLGLMKPGSSLARHQDIIDAILVGALGVTRVQAARSAGIAVEECFETGSRPSRGIPRGMLQ